MLFRSFALSLFLALPAAQAQLADSLALPADSLLADPLAVPVDTLDVPADSLAADSLAARRPALPVVSFSSDAAGRVVSGIPTRRPVFGAAHLLAEAPGAFLHDLGVPAAAGGVSFGGLGPRRTALTLGGVPVSNLLSGRPAFELLPLDVLAPLRLGPDGTEPVGVAADLRAFAAAVPVTELRYRTGPDGIQFISATHAQTRRPDFARALGGDRARLQALFHVSGRTADGEFAGVGVSGWQVIGRVGLALPAFSVEVTERHGRDRAGASDGVAPTGVFETVFDRANPLNPNAERETIRNDLAATLRLPVLPAPLTATAFWTAETFRYFGSNVPTGADTVGARADRVGLRLVQPLRIGVHRLRAVAEGWVTRTRRGTAFPGADRARTLHLAVHDSLALAGFDLGLEAGFTSAAAASFPVVGVRADQALGPVQAFVSARLAGATPSRVEREGFGGLAQPLGPARTERSLTLAAGFDAELGPFDLGLSGTLVQQTDPRVLLVEDGDLAAAFTTVDGAFRRATGTVRLAWRDRASRGLYLRLRANAHALLNAADSPVHERAAEAVPPVWGEARLGARALNLFDGNLDIDIAARGRGWSAFRGRSFHAPTALYALRPLNARPVDASGTLDLVTEAAIGSGRATVFIAYENLLASRAYAGAYVVPVYPLPNPRLRFGVFWLLPN
ncbi:MAG: hypothetical protein AAGI91_00790 [Bacteroidota bacterium]